MMVHDPRTGLVVGDPEAPIVPAEFARRSSTEIATLAQTAIARMILSASGWRTVFAQDGSQHSATADVDPALLVLTALAGRVCAEFTAEKTARMTGDAPRLVVGLDTRPTGPMIARAAIRAMLRVGASVEHAFVCASPELMAYASANRELDGFFYVSASHNPLGHNGVKMGGSNGGVYGGDEAADLLDRFRAIARDHALLKETAELLAGPPVPGEQTCIGSVGRVKDAALSAYTAFCHRVIAGGGARAPRAYDAFRRAVAATRPGIVGDLNGSARTASIDRAFFSQTGCRLHFMNASPGEIAHQIVPEGEGLSPCAMEIERLANAGEPFEIGYVPDNDGDRGNLVVFDPSARRARPMEAQEVFALCCVSELAWLVHTGEVEYDARQAPTRQIAIVVNGPTSMRVDRIAEVFGATVFRSEVGEANVVTLAREIREQGYLVRILGEGSNGGNITHPSAVRDPLHTVHSVLKLLYAPASDESPSPAAIWFERAGVAPPQSVTVTGILDTLPRFTTTSAFEPRAIMEITSTSHAALKSRFEALLPQAFTRLLEFLPPELEIAGYDVVNYERTRTLAGPGNRSGAERGGLKVLMRDRSGVPRASAWMRGSGTEPVFRIMADVEGEQPETEATILDWLRHLVEKADAARSGTA